MKRILKSSAIAALAALILALSGCSVLKKNSSPSSSSAKSPSSSSQASSAPVQTSGVFSLPYNSVSGFNPLLPTTQSNLVLWPLMYDCLAEPGTNYKPVMRLAQSVDNSGTTVTAHLKSGLVFSDGSALTAQDVKYSLDLAKAHTESPFSAQLSDVQSIDADGLDVTFHLKAPDPLFVNLLAIPIIKTGSDQDGDAIGSGPYVISESGINATLTLNKNWDGGQTLPSFKTIPLVNIPNANAVMSSLSIGEVNYVYSDNGDGAAVSSSSVNTATSPVNLNQLVYVGVNAAEPHLNNPHFRKALSLSIDRAGLVSQTYSGRALGSVLPFNPSWSGLPQPKASDLNADFTDEGSQMSLAGGTGTSTSFTLLVDQENSVRTAAARFVANCLDRTGITVNVKAVPFTQYKTMIAEGNFDLYIGEEKLQDDMDISPLLTPGAVAPVASTAGSATLSAFTAWKNGSGSLDAVSKAFGDETPFIPLCYRTGTTSYTKGLNGVVATDSDIFFDFEKWSLD